MKVDGRARRSIVRVDGSWAVEVIDQTLLPFRFETRRLESLADAVDAIAHMCVRGAPLIGITAAYGVCLALRADPSDAALRSAIDALLATRPTGANLAWALERMRATLHDVPEADRAAQAYDLADELAEEDVRLCEAIGRHGLPLIRELHDASSGEAVNVLTHCNAGWLATVDWGTALAPLYMAHDDGIPLHVWVDETRPRNQGAALTAWELLQHGVPHTVIADNAGGHLMQTGQVDLLITGCDRVTLQGGVYNKIGTYLKALAARENGVPFFVAAPGPTIDWSRAAGTGGAIIEERGAHEVTEIRGAAPDGTVVTVRLTPPGSPAANPAFDFTPPHLVSGLVTERGVCEATSAGLRGLYPDRAGPAAAHPADPTAR